MDIIETFEKIGIHLSDKQVEQLDTYYNLLFEKNKVMNLTAITEYEEVIIKHFIDSALVNCVFPMDKEYNVIDVGTGAGFPGLVLKIVFPSLRITLLDSLNKRVNFLNEVINALGLENITAIHSRAEDAGMNKIYREKYDICVSRAVANLASLSEYCIPFIKKEGYFISYKAEDCEVEVDNSKKAISTLGCVIDKVSECKLPKTDIIRKFVVIRKIKNTPAKYPRKAGVPSKEPIV